MKVYEIYKAGHRSYVVISKKMNKEQALTLANEHFRAKKSDLIIESARTLGDDELIVPNKTGDVWAVSRKGIEG